LSRSSEVRRRGGSGCAAGHAMTLHGDHCRQLWRRWETPGDHHAAPLPCNSATAATTGALATPSTMGAALLLATSPNPALWSAIHPNGGGGWGEERRPG
jgi:hypothetical protein